MVANQRVQKEMHVVVHVGELERVHERVDATRDKPHRQATATRSARQPDPGAVLSSSASSAELCVQDPEGQTPLAAAIAEKKYDCAKVLLGYDAALAIPEKELKAYNLIQKCKKEAAMEEPPEDVEIVDVNDAEWQKTKNEEMFGPGEKLRWA